LEQVLSKKKLPDDYDSKKDPTDFSVRDEEILWNEFGQPPQDEI